MAATSPSTFDIRSLLTPSAFPHSVDRIELKETHVSWVILTGPFAYKIKKSVQLDFIDAGTLERRRFLCDEELRLNRRLAGEMYVDVVPIVAEASGLKICGHGAPIEYAVRMKQFAAADELATLLAERDVSRDEIEMLAMLLSDFHGRAPRLPPEQSAPATDRLLNGVLENLDELTDTQDSFELASRVAPIAAWLRARIETDRAVFAKRAQCGYIRECHGDLHAGNIVRDGGRLLPFDCLEFNPDLRWIDVIDDLAFLAMDLASHERHDLACSLLSRYLEHGGDYAGVRLLPFYAVHRALVRTKVDALSARLVPKRSNEFRERMQRRLRCAQGWIERRRPALVLMHGVSGSGKSWLSERLIPALPAVRIRSDVERKRLAGLAASDSATADLQAGLYSPEFTARTYAHLSDCAAHCLQAGMTTIVDATFLGASERAQFEALAERLGLAYVIVACTAERSLLERRIRERAASGERISDADLTVLEAQLQIRAPFSARELPAVVNVDMHISPAITDVVSAIGARMEATR